MGPRAQLLNTDTIFFGAPAHLCTVLTLAERSLDFDGIESWEGNKIIFRASVFHLVVIAGDKS